MPNIKPPPDTAATLEAVVDHLLDQAAPFGLNITVKVWSWVDSDGEVRVSAKTIPFEQLYVTYEPDQSWPASVMASSPASRRFRRDPVSPGPSHPSAHPSG